MVLTNVLESHFELILIECALARLVHRVEQFLNGDKLVFIHEHVRNQRQNASLHFLVFLSLFRLIDSSELVQRNEGANRVVSLNLVIVELLDNLFVRVRDPVMIQRFMSCHSHQSLTIGKFRVSCLLAHFLILLIALFDILDKKQSSQEILNNFGLFLKLFTGPNRVRLTVVNITIRISFIFKKIIIVLESFEFLQKIIHGPLVRLLAITTKTEGHVLAD